MCDKEPHVLFTENFIRVVPELKNLYDEHLSDNEELLPHIFFYDVAVYVADLARREDRQDSSVMKRILDYLEQGMRTGHDSTKEVISLSFLENLAEYHGDAVSRLSGRLGPSLMRELDQYKT